MIKLAKVLVPALIVTSLSVGCGQSGASKTDDEIIVKTSRMDIHFSRSRPFKNTYVIFGGLEMPQSDAFNSISLAGLDIGTARSIYSSYPDFHMCKSPGAPLAQRSVRDLDIVPANSKILKELRKTLAKHRESINEGGGLVCVKLEGEVVRLTSAIVREMNENIIDKLPPQVHRDYFFVESAKLIDSQEALENK